MTRPALFDCKNKDTDLILPLRKAKKARVQIQLVSLLEVKDRSSIPILACLTRPGQQDRGVGFAQFEDAGFHVPGDVFHKAPHGFG